jgi:soluble lytic murein transglycosylase-like protein
MTEQRRIDLLFAAAVVALRAGRAARRAGPGLAMLLVVAVAVHGTLGGPIGTATPRVVAAVTSGEIVASRTPAPVAVEPAAAPPGPEPQPQPTAVVVPPDELRRAPPVLDREQQNIARFIAQRYRVTLDSTSEFVHHAYRAARDLKVDPMLVLAVMSVESSFNPRAQSHAGAQGLMQVLTRVHVEKFLPFGGIAAALDPVANIRVGSAILKEYLNREGTVEGALKSYVGAALAEHDGGYGLKVLNARERIAAAAAGRPIPPEVDASAARRERESQQAQAQPQDRMQPVSAIVETRTPLPVDDGRPAAGTVVDPVPAPILPPPADLRSHAPRDLQMRSALDAEWVRSGSI